MAAGRLLLPVLLLIWLSGGGEALQLRMVSTPLNPTLPSLAGVPYRISQLVDRSQLESVRFRYLTVATEQLAGECRSMLAAGAAEFGDLAKSLSLDELTRENGGMAGWVTVDEKTPSGEAPGGAGAGAGAGAALSSSSAGQQLYPREVVNKACNMNKGDIAVVQSQPSGLFHVVQLIDAQARLSPQLIRRRREAYWQANNLLLPSSPPPSPTSSEQQQQQHQQEQGQQEQEQGEPRLARKLEYYMDTMGCQMNVADSERMEGQLRDLGFTRSAEPYAAHQPPAASASASASASAR